MKQQTKLFLLGIVFLAILLRFWNLGNVPASPDWDEAALGYNAFSILHTGKDEYRQFLPLILRSFDDYKPGLYAYFIIPFILVFNLTTFAVRFPSALFGVGMVCATFFLVKNMFNMFSENKKNHTTIALLSTFFLAISPWHIQFSRVAFESNVGVAFNTFAILVFILSLRKSLLFPLAIFLAGVNIYIYQSEKVFTPLIFTALVVLFRKELLKMKKNLLLGVIVGMLTITPFVFYTVKNPETFARAKGVSVFSDQTSLLKETAKKLQYDRENKNYIGYFFDNRRIIYAKSIISGYISHFDLNWLFLRGDLARHHAPGMGLLYLWELPFVLIGIYHLVFGEYNKKTKLLLMSWFLIAPIPASITSGVPHAVRTLNFLPIFQVFTALGVYTTIHALKNKKDFFRLGIYSLSGIFFLWNFFYFLNQYFVQYNYFDSKEWQYGYKEAVELTRKLEKGYDKVVISNKPLLDQSYIFYLFYLRYDPTLYQNESKNASGGFRENHYFGKYEFRPISWREDRMLKKTLFVGRPEDFPQEIMPYKTINYLDGTSAIKIVLN